MDALRILRRSTNLVRQPKPGVAAAGIGKSSLPSAGVAANPQMFNTEKTDVGTLSSSSTNNTTGQSQLQNKSTTTKKSKSKKRKRGAAAGPGSGSNQDSNSEVKTVDDSVWELQQQQSGTSECSSLLASKRDLPSDFFGSAFSTTKTTTTTATADDDTGEPKKSKKKQKREAAALAQAQDLTTYLHPHERNVQTLGAHKIKVTVLTELVAEGEGKGKGKGKTKGSKEDGDEDEDGDSMKDVSDSSKKKNKKRSDKKKKKKCKDEDEDELDSDEEIFQDPREKNQKKNKRRTQLFPQSLASFSHLPYFLDAAPRLWQNIQAQGYDLPTEVQLSTIPLQMNLPRAMINALPSPSQSAESSALSSSSASSSSPSLPSLLSTAPFADLLTVAPTGSGKTLAFLIPAIQSALLHRRKRGAEMDSKLSTSTADSSNLSPREPIAIVLAPTKELASQIVNEGRKLTLNSAVRVTLFRKGMKIAGAERVVGSKGADDGEEEVADEESDDDSGDESGSGSGSESESESESRIPPPVKADIIVSTPLLLLHSLQEADKTVFSLPSIRHFILDEADVLLDPLFREQTVAIWRACTSPELRSSLWSATMSSTIEEVATSVISDLRSRHTAADQSISPSSSSSSSKLLSQPQPPLLRVVVGLKDTALPSISHKLIYAATEQGKLLGIRQLLRPNAPTADQGPILRPPFIIFTQTIPRAIALYSELKYDIPAEAGGSARLAVLHSDLTDQARDEVMTGFRKGEIWVLITTDLLARGMDFRGVNGVVNYDMPTSPVSYIHRVGRTGRAGREGGVAVTYYTKEDVPYIRAIANIIAASEKLRDGSKSSASASATTSTSAVKGSGAAIPSSSTTAAPASTATPTIPQWMLDILPTASKQEKQTLKRRGVQARRVGLKEAMDGGKKGWEVRISTKSGYDRRMENKRKQSRAVSLAKKGKKEDSDDD